MLPQRAIRTDQGFRIWIQLRRILRKHANRGLSPNLRRLSSRNSEPDRGHYCDISVSDFFALMVTGDPGISSDIALRREFLAL